MKRWLAGLSLLLSMCAKPPAPSPAPPAPVPEPPTSAPASAEAPPPARTDAGSDAGLALPKSDPMRFTCGHITCASGSETCCLASTDVVCLPSSPDGPHGAIGFLSAQWEACDKAPYEHGYSMSGISRCDESIDCKAQQVCCEEFLFSGSTVNLCAPELASGESPCEFGEPCVEGSPCRVRGTECQRGYCVKPVKQARCGQAELCTDGESCCGEPLRCKPDAQCDARQPRIGCARPAECVGGHQCVYAENSGSYCTGHLDFVTPNWFEERGLTILCERDADCRAKCARGGKMRCKASPLPWLRGCECP